jgi:hypothetical protein
MSRIKKALLIAVLFGGFVRNGRCDYAGVIPNPRRKWAPFAHQNDINLNYYRGYASPNMNIFSMIAQFEQYLFYGNMGKIDECLPKKRKTHPTSFFKNS